MMIEFVAATLDEVIAIENAGADRIMLASAPEGGGITPSIGFTVLALGAAGIPVDIMIRPHSMGFCYSNADLDVIEADLCAAAETKAASVVIGMLDSSGNANINALERLIPKVRDKGIIFNLLGARASDIVDAARAVSAYEEVKAVLTTGGLGAFNPRMKNVRKMRDAAPELEIIVCGGINADNLAEAVELSGSNSFIAGIAGGFSADKAAEFISFAKTIK